jgi:hypothetical protein
VQLTRLIQHSAKMATQWYNHTANYDRLSIVVLYISSGCWLMFSPVNLKEALKVEYAQALGVGHGNEPAAVRAPQPPPQEDEGTSPLVTVGYT